MPAPHPFPRLLPAGDAAVLVELGDLISPEINRRVHALDRAIRDAEVQGVKDLVPAYRSLLVLFDPLAIDAAALRARLATLAARLGDRPAPARPIVRIPTCYGGVYGPDLGHVAAHAGLTADEVIAIHTGGTYLVYMMGFSPGFAYLGGLSPRIATPRLKTPRTAIPAGSVGIAQQQTGIYPVESPGGWQLIGRTPVPLFDPRRDPPTAVEPGDSVRFVPVDEPSYLAIAERVIAGVYRFEVEPEEEVHGSAKPTPC